MHFTHLLVALALSLAGATAVPNGNSRRLPVSRRSQLKRGAGPVRLIPKPPSLANASHNEFSTNWAGAAYHDYPPGSFTKARATITVPSASRPPGGNAQTDYYGSAWVGIDGYSACSGAILQTGIDWVVPAGGGQVDYYAWYEWYPEESFEFDGDLLIENGDTLNFTVQAFSPTSGVAIVENLSTGARVEQQLTSDVALCQTDAEWIVEDFDIDDGAAPFANFGSVTFSNVLASSASGGIIGAGGNATLIDLEQDDSAGVLAQTVLKGATVVVKYG